MKTMKVLREMIIKKIIIQQNQLEKLIVAIIV
jgi:hypothetical protein